MSIGDRTAVYTDFVGYGKGVYGVTGKPRDHKRVDYEVAGCRDRHGIQTLGALRIRDEFVGTGRYDPIQRDPKIRNEVGDCVRGETIELHRGSGVGSFVGGSGILSIA